jgi:hypothetical protein
MMTQACLCDPASAGILVLPLAEPTWPANETEIVDSENAVERGFTITRKADREAINARVRPSASPRPSWNPAFTSMLAHPAPCRTIGWW